MNKYVVFGGFLGAGKTTSMIAFSEYLRKTGRSPAILVNDLGAKNLVDGEFTAYAGCCCDTITGGCICYKTGELVEALRRFRDTSKADIVFSDIPGCGIGALDHVYHALAQQYPDEFHICPFVAVADPERLRAIMPEKANLNLPEEMRYLFDAQLKEAEVIILNKIDLLTPDERREYREFLENTYPGRRVFLISAKTREGVGEAAEYLYGAKSKLPVVDIGYGGKEFIAAETRMSWYNRKFFSKSETPIDGNAFIRDLFADISRRLRDAGRNVPHLKIFVSGDKGETAKASLVGIDYDTVFDLSFKNPQKNLRVILNARAACESEVLDFLMDGAIRAVCEKYELSVHVCFTECFGMMDEGLE